MGACLQRSEACMKFVHPARRVLVAAASLSALLAVAACGGGGSAGTPSAGTSGGTGVDFTKQGDTEYWAGKDTSGNLPKIIAAFNAQHPNGKVTFHELPDSAD